MNAQRTHTGRRLIIGALAVIVAGGLTVAALHAKKSEPADRIFSTPLTRGDVTQSVVAAGTLNAVTTVQVGTQISGVISQLNADFNSIVHTGEVLARLDPSLYQAQLAQAEADEAAAQADDVRLKVAVTDAQRTLDRQEALAKKGLVTAADLDAARIALREAQSQVASGDAQVVQTKAALDQARLNLDKTIITAPINGIVTARNVDVGQTVAASLQAPTLFVIAADLKAMQVEASIDEAEVGRVAVGEPVTFRVEAYPDETFQAVVSQVRLNPTVDQNVVTYTAIISVSNEALELKPGMTATVSIRVAHAADVLRAPAAALRFKPTPDILAALGAPGMGGAGPSLTAPPAGQGRLWIDDGGHLRPVVVRTGVNDGTTIEVSGDGLTEGTPIVTMVATTPS
jgi:HlyD family secretion protein